VTGDYEEAASLFERAIVIWEAALGTDHPEVTMPRANLANVFIDSGDYMKAKVHLERVLAVLEQALGPEHPQLGNTLNSLAVVSRVIGDYATARVYLERALAISEASLGPSHPEVARALGTLANVLLDTGDYSGAQIRLERALAIYEKALGLDHVDAAITLNGLGVVSRARGDYVQAQAHFKRALDISEKSLGPEHPEVARHLDNLGTVYNDIGDYARAQPLFDRALTIWESSVGSEHPDMAATLDHLASLRLKTGHREDALVTALRAEAISREHLRLMARTLPEEQALRYAEVRTSTLNLILTLAYGGLDASEASKAWDGIVRSRALVLDEMGARHRAVSGLDDEKVANLYQELQSSSKRLANLSVSGPGEDGSDRYRVLMDAARQSKREAERALAEQSAAFRREQMREQIGLDDVKQALPRGSALIAYVRYDRLPEQQSESVLDPSADASSKQERSQGNASYLAWILRSDNRDVVSVSVGEAEEIEVLVAHWSEALRRSAEQLHADEEADAACHAFGATLRQRIWDPVAQHVGDAERVFVVLDGALHLVSLAALPTDGQHYLVEDGPLLHYLSAERDLVRLDSETNIGSGLLALGGPAFDETGTGQPWSTGLYRGSRSRCADFKTLRFQPLPATLHEAQDVVSLWESSRGTSQVGQAGWEQQAEDVVLATGAQANEAVFKEQSPGRRVLHVATHGFFLGTDCPSAIGQTRGLGGLRPVTADTSSQVRGENPLLLSGLALAGANHRQSAGPDEEDGILTAEEIAALDLGGVEWAVLSACETGVGTVQSGEGVFGLRRAFEVAGAGSLIMSLWSVEDESARAWMRALYESRLIEGKDTAESVRAASLQVLTNRRSAADLSTSPFYWAGFVAAGDWR
jgi:CHAT domain-containing protein/Tfp pilus assembly protein PilF